MFDPSILMRLEATMPPQIPPIAEARVPPLQPGATARRVGVRLTAAFDHAADNWIAGLDAIRAQAETIASFGAASPNDLTALDDLIDEFETHADMRAKQSARLAKRIRRDVKAQFAADPSSGAAARQAGDRIIATDKRVVEALLDYALFLRALRAEGDPAGRGGPVFDDPEALQRYLDSLAA